MPVCHHVILCPLSGHPLHPSSSPPPRSATAAVMSCLPKVSLSIILESGGSPRAHVVLFMCGPLGDTTRNPLIGDGFLVTDLENVTNRRLQGLTCVGYPAQGPKPACIYKGVQNPHPSCLLSTPAAAPTSPYRSCLPFSSHCPHPVRCGGALYPTSGLSTEEASAQHGGGRGWRPTPALRREEAGARHVEEADGGSAA
jgi:hypothetical protein